MFPGVLRASFTLSLLAATVAAQNAPLRPRQVSINPFGESARLETEPVIISEASSETMDEPELSAPAPAARAPRMLRFDRMLSSAIDARLGVRYVWGAAGPTGYDCSGFVWSAFQQTGIRFDRSSARSLWTRFAPARPDEQYKFGTLVFFNRQTHIGIVADERGFYHASRRHGVVYSPFNNYWLSRIDGFRRVPLTPAQLLAD